MNDLPYRTNAADYKECEAAPYRLAQRRLPNGQYRQSPAAALRASACRIEWVGRQRNRQFWETRSFLEVDRAMRLARLAQRMSVAHSARLRAPSVRTARAHGPRPCRTRGSRRRSLRSSARAAPSDDSGSSGDSDPPQLGHRSRASALSEALSRWFLRFSDKDLQRISRGGRP
jgi:hypothetical protein